MSVLLVCGSREWTDRETMKRWLSRWEPRPHDRAAVYAVVHGGARGADAMAGEVARELGFVPIVYAVDVAVDGPWPAAGVRRNARMLEAERERVRHVLAFTTSGPRCGMTRGTADMVERCLRVGLAVTIVPQRVGP